MEETKECFPDEKLLALTVVEPSAIASDATTPWFADIVNFLVSKVVPPTMTYQQKKRFFHTIKQYYSDESFLYKKCPDQLMRRCLAEEVQHKVL